MRAYRSWSWSRGVAHASADDKYYVVALNTPDILSPLFGKIVVSVCSDGRFGYADPLNWPQIYCASRPWLALIPRRPTDSSPLHALWHSPTLAEFIQADEQVDARTPYGHLSSVLLARLETALGMLEKEVNTALADSALAPAEQDTVRKHWAATNNAFFMFHVPSTFRDIVRQYAHYHRCWAECSALVLWYLRVKRQYDLAVLNDSHYGAEPAQLEAGMLESGVIGVFCAERDVSVRMMAAGVPVWFLQLKDPLAEGPVQFGGRAEAKLVSHSDEIVDELGIGRASAYASKVGLDRASAYANRDKALDRLLSNLGPRNRTELAGERLVDAIWEESARILDMERTPFPANFGEDGWDTVDSRGPENSTAGTSAAHRK